MDMEKSVGTCRFGIGLTREEQVHTFGVLLLGVLLCLLGVLVSSCLYEVFELRPSSVI